VRNAHSPTQKGRSESTVDGIFLSGIRRRPGLVLEDKFPWTMPLFRDLRQVEFKSPVTFLVGENGSGKSTLLEGLAVGVNAIAAGSDELQQDGTLWSAHEFARAFRFIRRRPPRRAMFLRAEDVLGYTLRAARLRKEAGLAMGLGIRWAELSGDDADDGAETDSTESPANRLKKRLTKKYGVDPVARSHGETFLELLDQRLRPGSLYFLDEPETPLSPTRVLAQLSLIKDRAANDCQFVIATHSPILMAVPQAEILLFEGGSIRSVPYEEVEHVRITRAFLRDPEKFLRQL
jgi:predicted ATPase